MKTFAASTIRVGLVIALLSSVPRAVLGQEPATEPGALFREATRAHDSGDYRRAAQLFFEAHHIRPSGAAIYNAGRAWLQAGEATRAADAFQEAVSRTDLDEGRRMHAVSRLRQLRSQLGRVTCTGSSSVSLRIDQGPWIHLPVERYLAPGVHQLSTQGSTPPTRRTLTIEAGQHMIIELAAATRPEPAPVPVQDPTPALITEASESPPLAGWILTGTGLAAAGTAIGLGVAALDAKSAYEASGNTDLNARNRASDLRLGSNIAWGAAALTGGIGLTLLLIHWLDDSSDAPAMAIAPGGATYVAKF